MQVELSLEELKEIQDALSLYYDDSNDLEPKIYEAVRELEELESMNFDDCAGGACKL